MMPPDEADEAFMRTIVIPEEDRQSYYTAPWTGGFRWFRSVNIIPLEKYRAPGFRFERRDVVSAAQRAAQSGKPAATILSFTKQRQRPAPRFGGPSGNNAA